MLWLRVNAVGTDIAFDLSRRDSTIESTIDADDRGGSDPGCRITGSSTTGTGTGTGGHLTCHDRTLVLMMELTMEANTLLLQYFAAITCRLTRTLSASCCQTSDILVLPFGTDGINTTAESVFRAAAAVLPLSPAWCPGSYRFSAYHSVSSSHARNPQSAWHSGFLRMSAGLLVNTTLYSVLACSYMQHYLHGIFRAHSAAYQASGCLSL